MKDGQNIVLCRGTRIYADVSNSVSPFHVEWMDWTFLTIDEGSPILCSFERNDGGERAERERERE